MNRFLLKMKKKEGRNRKENQPDVTDNESVVIYSPKGYIQGYAGIVVSGQKSQVITSAQAFGSAYEAEHMPEMFDKNAENLEGAGVTAEEGSKPTILGDPKEPLIKW
jgi:hypothetical protein